MILGRAAFRVPKYISMSLPFRPAVWSGRRSWCFVRRIRLPLSGTGCLRPHHIDRGGVNRIRNMRGIMLLDHLNGRAAILCHLIDVRPLGEAKAYISVPKAVECTRLPIPIEFQIHGIQKLPEHLRMGLREHVIRRLRVFRRQHWIRILPAPVPPLLAARWFRPVSCPLIRQDRARHALAVPNTAFAANLNLQNPLPRPVVRDDGHIPVLQIPGLVRPQAGVPHEENKVMQLLGVPFELRLTGVTRVLP